MQAGWKGLPVLSLSLSDANRSLACRDKLRLRISKSIRLFMSSTDSSTVKFRLLKNQPNE